MEAFILILCIVLTVAFGVMALLMSKGEKKSEAHITTLRKQAAAPATNKPMLREKALESSFYQRVLFPLAQDVFDKTQRMIPLTNKSFVSQKLVHAGFQKSNHPKIFLGIQLLATVSLFGMVFILTVLPGKLPFMMGLMMSFGLGAAGYVMPLLWLIQECGKRQENIQRSLPDFLDLLVICVEAGLGLDIAINKLATLESVKLSEALRKELTRYITDINFGKPRKEALLDLADRTGVDDFSTIINALVQAYEMGTGVAQTLRVQSDSLRIKRLQKAEESANKIPVKMVLPIYIFLFPTIFLVIFGPMAMIVVEVIGKISSGMSGIR